MHLDRQAVIPLYYQLRVLIKQMVMEELSAGDPVPSERELAERYKISRMTARQAVNSLVEEGFLYRERGKGTFVSRSKIDKGAITPLTSFSEDVTARGMKASSLVLHFDTEDASKDIASVLDTQRVYKLRRVRRADDSPLALETSYLPVESFTNLSQYDFSTESLYKVLTQVYGVCFSRLRQSIFVHNVTSEEAKWLNLHSNASVLFATRTVFDVAGNPVEFTQAIYHPDKYRFAMDIRL